MLKPSFAATLALTLVSVLPLGCVEEGEGPPPAVAHHEGRGGHVPFRGVFAKFAESTFKNGRRIRVANSNGAATVRVEHGKVTYDQTYVSHGELKRVVQIYTFSPSDVHRTGPGDYEVFLTFRGIRGDTSGYSPDRHDPKLEAHRLPSGWEVDLFTTDNNNVIGIVEFQ